MNNLISLKERLVAIGEFATEAVALIDGLAEVKETAPTKGKSAPAGKTSADPLADIISKHKLADLGIPELKEILKDAEIEYNKKGKSASVFVNQIAQAILDGELSLDDEDESDDGDEVTEEEINEMDLKELIALAKEYEIEIPKAIAKKVEKVRELVLATLMEESEEVDEDEVLTAEEIALIVEENELDKADLADLKQILNDNEVEFPAKAKKPTLVNLVAWGIADGTITLEDEGEGEDEEEGYTAEDIEALTLKQAIALAKENEVEIPAKIAKNEEKVKALLVEALVSDDEDEDESDDEDELTEEDINAMSLPELLALAEEYEIEIPKAILKKADKIKELLIGELIGEEITEDDVKAMDLKELTELAEENEVEIPAKIAKKVESVRKLILETLF